MLKQSHSSKLPHNGTSIFSQGIRSWRAELRLEMASFYMVREQLKKTGRKKASWREVIKHFPSNWHLASAKVHALFPLNMYNMMWFSLKLSNSQSPHSGRQVGRGWERGVRRKRGDHFQVIRKSIVSSCNPLSAFSMCQWHHSELCSFAGVDIGLFQQQPSSYILQRS